MVSTRETRGVKRKKEGGGWRLIRNVVESKYKGERGGWMVRFGSGTIELERIRPRRIPLHFFRHELELHTETSGVKSGSARSPEGGGEAMERGKRQLGLSLARHPPRLVARVNRSISILFYHQNCTASFSNPSLLPSRPLAEIAAKFFEFRLSLERFLLDRKLERQREKRERHTILHATTRFDLHFPPRVHGSIHGYSTA